jgi:hypothetical protein
MPDDGVSIEISTCRAHAWDAVAFREHTINKAFVGDTEGKELILVGTLRMRTKAKPDVDVVAEFAGRGSVVDGAGGKPRLALWQAYGGNMKSTAQ